MTERDAVAVYQLEVEKNHGRVKSAHFIHQDGTPITDAELASAGLSVHTVRMKRQSYVALFRDDSDKRVSNWVPV